MFNGIFKRKKLPVETMRTTEQIAEFVQQKRVVDSAEAEQQRDGRAESIKRINQFPLMLPVNELEISAACGVGWLQTLIAMRTLLNSGQWGHITVDKVPLLQRVW